MRPNSPIARAVLCLSACVLFSGNAHAEDQWCQSYARPESNKVVYMVAALTSIKNACGRANPSRADDYAKGLANFISSNNIDLRKTQASPLFPAMLKCAEAGLAHDLANQPVPADQALTNLCNDLLKQAKP